MFTDILIKGRRGHPVWDVLRKYRYAHRGYHQKPHIPENSIAAFRRAAERGWGAELDVHLLRDGNLAVFHDSDLMRCTGEKGIIEELDKAQLSRLRLEGTEERVPLLEEILELFTGRGPLIIEMKTRKGNHKALADALYARLRNYSGHYCVESFDPRAIARMKKIAPRVCRGQLASDFLREENELPKIQKYLLGNLMLNFLGRPDFIAYKFSGRDNPYNRRAVGALGLQAVSWTICSRADMEAAEKEGSLVIFEQFDPDA